MSASSDPAFASWLLSAFSAVLPKRGATYCCGPITSGKKAFEWCRSNGLVGVAYDELTRVQQRSFCADVVDANVHLLHQTADVIRSRSSNPVIDPAGVPPVEGWKQQQWRAFWCEVIQEYASAVVVVPGWEYSIGAAGELVCALTIGLPVSTLTGECLDVRRVVVLIQEAVQEMESAGVRCSALRECVNSLEGTTE